MKVTFALTVILLVCGTTGVFGCGGGSGGSSSRGSSSGSEASNRLCFTSICSGNPSNDRRGSDSWGSGAYGASRGSRTHKGIDVKCYPYSSVYSPFPAKVIRVARPYRNNNKPHNTGIYMTGTGQWSGYSVKMFYVRKRQGNGVYVSAGSYIGEMTNMAAQYGSGMTNHIHVQLYKNGGIIDPTSYLC